jgi:hypothetical protein
MLWQWVDSEAASVHMAYCKAIRESDFDGPLAHVKYRVRCSTGMSGWTLSKYN